MDTEAMDELGQDAAAVAAVRDGDAERYRELVERHERRVFAVAWSRLGDAQLAEEATQEAFIKGYRRLWLLGDGAKFAGWITSIARNAAINLGLRHRRELQKRERWALEQPSSAGSGTDEAEVIHSPEMLRETLLSLPATHRECLVLFYLEGKSGEEAAQALGISESAFRVRLHRAKAVLREQLEEKLAGSLEKLRPSKALVPAVMAAVLATSTAQAATTGGAVGVGLGAKALSTLGKSALFGWFSSCIGLVAMLPGMLMAWWWGKLERQNFREPDGFRTRMHDRSYRSLWWGFPVVMVFIFLFNRLGEAAWGIRTTIGITACFLLVPLLFGLRSLAINRSRFALASLSYAWMVFMTLAGVSLGFIPFGVMMVPLVLACTLLSFFQQDRPVRMDYNLFLRAAQKMLRQTNTEVPPASIPLRHQECLSFARFLGERWLVCDFRRDIHGLTLYLTPMSNSFLQNILRGFLPWRRNASSLCLKADGSVTAHCGARDFSALHAMEVGRDCPIADLETQVGIAVGQAWQAYRQGDTAAARRLLGDVADEEVFLVPPSRSPAMRWRQAVMLVTLALLVALLLVKHLQPQWLSDLKPVALTETQVRAALSEFGNGTAAGNSLSNGLAYTLSTGFVLPAKELFTAPTFQQVQKEALRRAGVSLEDVSSARPYPPVYGWLFERLVTEHWVELAELQTTPADYSAHLRRKELVWKFQLSHRAIGNDTNKFVYGLENMQLAQLRLLKQTDCLDLLDREKLIRQLASWQVANGDAYADRPSMADWRQARGLSATSGWPALHDTYCVVAALEILGGLDKIDREACIEGVLRLHHAAGLFQSTGAYENWKLKVSGDAHDTFCAFETLRILGALDRVTDLEHWQFRVRPNRHAPEVSWDEIEAWVCQQRLARVLQEHQQNPQAPIRSLLEP